MKNRLLYLLATFVLTMLIFVVAKVVFMLSYTDSEAFSLADVCNVISHGLSLDCSTSLYVLAVPLLTMMASVWVKVPRWILKVYYALIATALSLAFVADASLYAFWHFKLDASCLQYLETPTEAMASVTTGYLMLRILIFLISAALIYAAYFGCERLTLAASPRSAPETLKRRIAESLLYLLAIPFIIIGIRGGLDESTTNIGQVYYSQNQFLNHSAVNPVFSFLSSIDKSGNYIVEYRFMDDDACASLTDSLFFTRSTPADTLLTTQRPNIVLIVMESCGGQFTSLGGHAEITPRLNRLADESVFFAECYANSWRTDKGLVSILSGYPAFPVTSVMKIPEKSRKMASIASALKQEGYATAFYYGGDINFTNMRSYVMGTGYEQLSWKADYPGEWQRSAKWGIRDDLMFASLLQDIKGETSGRWMKTLLTLSSHEPWDVPARQLDDEVFNAFRYLDGCIGQFVDSLRQLPQWKDMLVVILPDHGYRYRGIDETTRLYNHIPMIWTGGAVGPSRRIGTVCSQSDLAATLLGQMGLSHEAFTFSRDVLSADYRHPMAFHTFNNGMTLIDSAGFTAYDLDAERVVASSDDKTEKRLSTARALLQLTSEDFIRK